MLLCTVLYIVNLRNLQAEGVTEAEARYPAEATAEAGHKTYKAGYKS